MIRRDTLNYIKTLDVKIDIVEMQGSRKIEKQFIAMSQQYQAKLLQLSEPAFDYFGATQLCYTHIDYDGDAYCINTHSELWKFYMENQCYKYDPLVKDSELINEGFVVWSSYLNKRYVKIALYGFNSNFNIGQGVTVVEKDDSGVTSFAFGGPKDNPYMINRILSDQRMLKGFMDYIESNMREEIEHLNNNRLSFGFLKGDSFYENDIGHLSIGSDAKVKYMTEIGMISSEDLKLLKTKLSKRQTQFAMLYLKGFTANIIAELLKISVGTVNNMIKEVRVRLRLKGQDKQLLLSTLQKMNDMGCFDKCAHPKFKEDGRVSQNSLSFQYMPKDISRKASSDIFAHS